MAANNMVRVRSRRESNSKLPPLVRMVVLTLISLFIWWSPFVSSFALALRDEQHTHLLLIIPISVALLYLKRPSSEIYEEGEAPYGVGILLLAAAVALTVLTRLQVFQLHADEQLSLYMVALVLWWIGSFILAFGTPAFRRALFPLCFLFWIVPLPEVLLAPIVRLLQEGSVASAQFLFAAFGVPVAQDGTRLTIPGLTVEIARECSSIRSSLMLMVTTMVLAYTLLRSTWRRASIIAVAVPLSVLKNGLRVFVLAMLTTRVDHSFITGRLHHQGGIIYFLIALAAIIFLIWIAHRSENKSKKSKSLPADSPELAASGLRFQ
jgi:exosortase